jgi:predicted Rossmann fold flavoprotein
MAGCYDVIVVGGGAAGLLAAGRAAECGAATLLLEKTPRLGNKVRLAGGGRCNFTHIADLQSFLSAYGPQGRFLQQAFARFFHRELIELFRRFGLPAVIEEDGRVFPASGHAGDVVKALERYLHAGRVEVRLNTAVLGLQISAGAAQGVLTRQGELPAKAIVLATGGASYPATGSAGDGYGWLASAGHTIHPLLPALVPLETVADWPRRLAGLTLSDVDVTLLAGGRPIGRRRGEVLFTHFGLSGPAILSLSGAAAEALQHGAVEVSLDLQPAYSDENLDAILRAGLEQHGRRTLRTVLRARLPARLADTFLELAQLSGDKPAAHVSAGERRRLIAGLRDLRIGIARTRPLHEAMVTAGGVELKEIDPRTMASRLVRGLYVAGELLNVHGDTGGYNLQAAFSTGYVAGQSAAAFSAG